MRGTLWQVFEHLRIRGAEPVSGARLTDLGRINVVAGPNNSGKTTLLRAIADPETCVRGVFVDPDLADLISQLSRLNAPWADRESAIPSYDRLVRDLLESRVWYADEAEELRNAFLMRVHFDDVLSQLRIDGRKLARRFSDRFNAHPKTVLIPAKRAIDPEPPLASVASVEPSGAGLVRYLFSAKNQPPNAPDRSLYDLIRDAFRQISGGYSFEPFMGSANTVSLRFFSGADWRPADQCGLGLLEVLLIVYFGLSPAYEVVLLEEPESHLHPALQRKLLHFLRAESDKQYFLSTHSNIFLTTSLVDRVFVTAAMDRVSVTDATSRTKLLNDLGYSVADNLMSDVVVLVEGPSDAAVLDELFAKSPAHREYLVKFWPLGGDIMDQVDLTVLAERHNVIALVDHDPGSKRVRERFTSRCSELGIPVRRLARYAIENYLPLHAFRTVFTEQMPDELELLNPNVRIADQVGFNVKRNLRSVARHTELADIAGTDLADFMKDVETMCRASAA